jgi:prepilin-type N-terminal cleavage/methylation domain-containing protein
MYNSINKISKVSIINRSLVLNFSKGFTLIELLIVIAILGVLAAAVIAAINPIKKINQAKDSTMKSNISQIVGALQASFTTNLGVYPATLGALVTTGEIKTLPVQQNGGGSYGYTVSTSCTSAACNVAVWGLYSDTTSFTGYCWDSTNNIYKNEPSGWAVPVPATPTCPN